MIYESYFWKRDLLKLSRKLTKRKSLEIWNEPDFGEFEKEIMIGFYVIRKLSEACKLSNATVSTKVNGRKLPSKGKIVHLMNNHKYLELYDFENAKKAKFDLAFLANQLVHSYVFSPYFHNDEENEEYSLAGVHFCSDKYRNECLYELSIDTIIDIFIKVGKDYPAAGSMEFDPRKNDYKLNWHNDITQLPGHDK